MRTPTSTSSRIWWPREAWRTVPWRGTRAELHVHRRCQTTHGVHRRHPARQPARAPALQGAHGAVGGSGRVPVTTLQPRAPATLDRASTVQQLFDAFGRATSSEPLFRQNLAAALNRLTKTHGFALTAEDTRAIEFIYRTAFFTDGPDLMYRRTDNVNAGRRPTYAELMTADDGQGRQRSYLADEASFAFLKDLQTRNLLVPVVGDFGGPKALRGVAQYARSHGATVSAFYLSNVETYLRRDGKWNAFCASVATMPLDASSTFIRSQAQSAGSSRPSGRCRTRRRRAARGDRAATR